jgi:adenosine deaminase
MPDRQSPRRPTPQRGSSGVQKSNIGLYAELHLHLGGAILPNILYAHMQREGHALLRRYPTYERFERFFTRKRSSLDDYLKMHTLVEGLQRPADPTLFYFVSRLIRGAYLFDNLAYMELRHTPFNRTDEHLDENARIDQMADVVRVIADAAASQRQRYPLVFTQILCTHTRLSPAVNRAIVELASQMRPHVSGVDVAGPNHLYRERLPELVRLFRLAKRLGLKTTAHLFETPTGCEPALLPYLDRIGHGIQIPLLFPKLLRDLAKRGQCLEVCPTTYLRTRTLTDYTDLRPVFQRCRDAGVDVVICTDNAGLHNVRLPTEYEHLLVRDVIGVAELGECLRNSYRHAFAWNGALPKALQKITLPT